MIFGAACAIDGRDSSTSVCGRPRWKRGQRSSPLSGFDDQQSLRHVLKADDLRVAQGRLSPFTAGWCADYVDRAVSLFKLRCRDLAVRRARGPWRTNGEKRLRLLEELRSAIGKNCFRIFFPEAGLRQPTRSTPPPAENLGPGEPPKNSKLFVCQTWYFFTITSFDDFLRSKPFRFRKSGLRHLAGHARLHTKIMYVGLPARLAPLFLFSEFRSHNFTVAKMSFHACDPPVTRDSLRKLYARSDKSRSQMIRVSFLRPIDQFDGTHRFLQELQACLRSYDYNQLLLSVAFAKSGPLLRLSPQLKEWK